MARQPHPADLETAQHIERATYFTVVFPAPEGQIKHEVKSLAIARQAGALLARIHQNGRKAMIYAITAEGHQRFVPDAYQPMENDMMTTIECATPSTRAPLAQHQPGRFVSRAYTDRSNCRKAMLKHAATHGREAGAYEISKRDGAFVFIGPAREPEQLAPEPIAPPAPIVSKESEMPKAQPAPKARKAPAQPAARASYDWKGAEAAAEKGVIPAAPDFSAETHRRFRPKLAEVTAILADKAKAPADKIKALRAIQINPVSTSPKAIARFRDMAVKALSAKVAQARGTRVTGTIFKNLG